MTIYWTLLVFSCLFYPVCTITYNRWHKFGDFCPVENKNIKAYFICVSIFMIAIIGLRSVTVGIDSWNYFFMFSDVRYEGISYAFDPKLELERGYVLFEILAHKAHMGFAGFNLVYAIFNVSVISYLIYKKSPMPWLSYFLYMCFSFFVLELTMMRQTLAISIVLLAVLTDKNETFMDFLKFVLWIFVAYMFHASAIVALPLWFLRKLPYNNTAVFIAIACVLIAYISKSTLTGWVEKVAAGISERYDGKEIAEGNLGLRLYAMIGVSVVPGVFIRRFHKDRWNTFTFYCLCAMLLVFPAVQAGGSLMRAYFYFYIFMMIYIPNLITALDVNKDWKIKILIAVLYLAVGIYLFHGSLTGNGMKIVPYKFYWQPLY